MQACHSAWQMAGRDRNKGSPSEYTGDSVHSPPEVAPPFCEVDGDRNVADERDKDNDSNPGLQSGGQVDTGCSNVKDLGPNVEDDGGQDALDGAGASVHDASDLPRLSVQVEVEVQV